jgi:DNA-binding TFAR19-related protein (PDSD5 family)
VRVFRDTSVMLTDLRPVTAALPVSRIALVKPEKARGVENMVLSMVQRGQIAEQVRVKATLGGVPSAAPGL